MKLNSTIWTTCWKALKATLASEGISGKARSRALPGQSNPSTVLADQE